MDTDGAQPTPASTGTSQHPEPPVDSLAYRLLQTKLLSRLVGDDSEPVKVDRFVIERELGAGGMGTIYAAWDEQLQRRVALKFLHPTGADAASELRLFREAQALAQLSHPNVVPIFDVGRHEGRVWLAMEHIPGQTLRDWGKTPRSQAELLEAWIAAGRGLAGIHASGLVHRDIKPANVMLGEDGRVRIVDFGLVRIAEASHPGSSEAGLLSAAEWAEGLTQPDGFVGTPAYAAPEQMTGDAIDARSDQFSFCVSLWEALCGKRPLRERRPDGQPVLRKGEHLPKRIHRALGRGLAMDPQERFDDMQGLLAALVAPRRRWLVPSLVGSCAAALGLVAGMIALGAPTAVAANPCAGAGTQIDEVWSEDSLAGLGTVLSEASAARTREVLDQWVGDWRSTAREACEAVHVRQQRSPASLDRRGVCLARRLARLTALGAAIEGGQITSDEQLIAWLARLEEPGDRLSESVLHSNIEAPPREHAQEVALVRQALVGLGMWTSGTSLARRTAEVEKLHSRATEIGWRPLIGEVALELGHLHILASDAFAARKQLGQALDSAELTDDAELQALTWSALNRVERRLSFDHERAEWTWEREAAVFTDLRPTLRQRARLLMDQALGLELASKRPEAEQVLREALSLYEAAGPTTAWEQASVLRTLANLVMEIGRSEEALVLQRRARELKTSCKPTSFHTRSHKLRVVVQGETAEHPRT